MAPLRGCRIEVTHCRDHKAPFTTRRRPAVSLGVGLWKALIGLIRKYGPPRGRRIGHVAVTAWYRGRTRRGRLSGRQCDSNHSRLPLPIQRSTGRGLGHGP